MKAILTLSLLMFSIPSMAVANVPSEAQLLEEVRGMSMPRVEARLKARAAVYRMYEETARSFGIDRRTAANDATSGGELALLRR